MSLETEPPGRVPEETASVARAAFPREQRLHADMGRVRRGLHLGGL
jgi:hypothetical protein